MFATGPGQSHTFSIFVDLIAEDLGISNTNISISYGAATLFAALGLSFFGKIRRPGRRPYCVDFGSDFSRCRLFFVRRRIGSVHAFPGIHADALSWPGFDDAGVDKSCGAMVQCPGRDGDEYFDVGFFASLALYPPLAQWLIETFGWRQAWAWLGVMTWVLMPPLLWFAVHDRPEPLRLLRDGVAPVAGEEQSKGGASAALTGLPLHTALRRLAYWMICAGLVTPAMIYVIIFGINTGANMTFLVAYGRNISAANIWAPLRGPASPLALSEHRSVRCLWVLPGTCSAPMTMF